MAKAAKRGAHTDAAAGERDEGAIPGTLLEVEDDVIRFETAGQGVLRLRRSAILGFLEERNMHGSYLLWAGGRVAIPMTAEEAYARLDELRR